MTRNEAIRRYCRQVERRMDLPRKRRRELLNGLRRELEEEYPPTEALTVEVLNRETGVPGETADILLNGVPREERERYRFWQKRLYIGVIAILAVITILTTSYALYMRATGGIAIIEIRSDMDEPDLEHRTNGEFEVYYYY